MKNYVQKGESIEVSGPSGGVVSGGAFLVGDLACVASVDIPEGSTGNARVIGVFDLPVTGADDAGDAAIAVGSTVYMDGAELNADSTNGTLFGKVLGAVEAGATVTIPVRLSN